VGVLGIAVRASRLKEDNREEDNLNLLFRFFDVNQSTELKVQTERHGEDALISELGFTAKDRCVLVQFKFSRRIPPTTIGTGELKRIFSTFEKK
jgi:hypothetical protein